MNKPNPDDLNPAEPNLNSCFPSRLWFWAFALAVGGVMVWMILK